MKKGTRVGVILLLIGVSFFAGTAYRGNSEDSFSVGGVFDLGPKTWSTAWEELGGTETSLKYRFWAPRELSLEVRATDVIDVYILDGDGINLFAKDGTVNPLWAFEETGQAIYTRQITERGKYLVLAYNPTNEPIKYKLNITIYGVEKDLLYASVAIIAAGLMVIAVSVMIQRKTQKQSTISK